MRSPVYIGSMMPVEDPQNQEAHATARAETMLTIESVVALYFRRPLARRPASRISCRSSDLI